MPIKHIFNINKLNNLLNNQLIKKSIVTLCILILETHINLIYINKIISVAI